MNEKGEFVGYEYKEIAVDSDNASMYLDGYACFGWEPDDNIPKKDYLGRTVIALKRNRKILNKMELTRLQRNFEACMEDINALENSKTQLATVISITAGLIGTAFMAGSVFAVTNDPPMIWLCALLAIPGFIGWMLAFPLYKRFSQRKTEAMLPLIEQKYDEIDAVCEKGNALLDR